MKLPIKNFISKLEALFQKWSEEEWSSEADAETAQKITHSFNELLSHVTKKHPEFDRDSFYSPEMLQFLHQYNQHPNWKLRACTILFLGEFGINIARVRK